MKTLKRCAVTALLAGMVTSVTFAGAALAQSVEEFYQGKTITLVVGSGVAGGDDTFARVVAKYLPKYIPGSPAVVVQNLPGAGGIVAATQMYNTQPRDGTVIGTVQRAVPMMPLLSEQPVEFDSQKLSWLGSLSKETNLVIVWNTSETTDFDDAFTRETVMGTTGGSSDSNVYALLLNKTLGTKFKIVGGYPGGPDIDLAMERGEVEGRVSITWTSLKGTRAEWIRDDKIRILAQMGLERNPELPEVPNVMEYVEDPLTRQVYEFLFSRQEAGRPFVAPPEVPADRLAALRQALADVSADPEFRVEIGKVGGTVELMDGEELQDMVDKYYGAPPEVIKATREALIVE